MNPKENKKDPRREVLEELARENKIERRGENG